METNQERVLAYRLATPIHEEELQTISGGSNPIVIPTLIVTGAPRVPDMSTDTHS